MTPVSLLRLAGGRATPLIRQSEASECGLACLAMIAGYHGYRVDLATLRRRFSLSLKGITLKTLVGMAEQTGFVCRAVRCEPEDLMQVQLPAILQVQSPATIERHRQGQHRGRGRIETSPQVLLALHDHRHRNRCVAGQGPARGNICVNHDRSAHQL